MKLDFTDDGRALPALRVFLAVVDRGGFAAAARTLGVSTSAVSQAVRALERRVGVPLLVRTTRSVNLTDAGRRLHEATAPALRDVLAALEAVPDDRPAGVLRLNAPTTAIGPVLQPLLAALAEAAPELTVELTTDDRLVDIVDEGFDAGFRLDETLRQDMVAVRASPPFRWVVAASPAYLADHGIPSTPEDLLRHRAVAYRFQTSGRIYEWELERDGVQRRLHPRWSVVVDGAVALRHAALAGLGLVYVDRPYVADDLRRGELVEVMTDWTPDAPGWFLYYPVRSQRLPKIRLLSELARANARRLDEGG